MFILGYGASVKKQLKDLLYYCNTMKVSNFAVLI